METWRFLASLGALLLVWTAAVTALGNPPSPGELIVAAVFGAIGIYASNLLVEYLDLE